MINRESLMALHTHTHTHTHRCFYQTKKGGCLFNFKNSLYGREGVVLSTLRDEL